MKGQVHLRKTMSNALDQLEKRTEVAYQRDKEWRVNEIGKVPPKRGHALDRRKPAPADMSWVDRLEPLDADAAAAALERPGPDSYERRDLKRD